MTVQITTYIPPSSDEQIEKFICCVMLQGKKNVARRIFNDMLKELSVRGHNDPKATFHRAVENVKPAKEVRPKRIGGAVYQVPFEVSPGRQQSLAYRWIINSARSRKGAPMSKKLAQEILDAAEGVGNAVRKRDDTHRMAEANRAFAHYARYGG